MKIEKEKGSNTMLFRHMAVILGILGYLAGELYATHCNILHFLLELLFAKLCYTQGLVLAAVNEEGMTTLSKHVDKATVIRGHYKFKHAAVCNASADPNVPPSMHVVARNSLSIYVSHRHSSLGLMTSTLSRRFHLCLSHCMREAT